MKKILGLAVAILFSLIIIPSARAEFRWGPSAGINVGTLKFKQDLMKVTSAVGPSVGVQGEMMFPGIGFGVDIGALYSMQGATMNLGECPIWAVDGYGKERSYLHTLSIPIDVRFKWTRLNGFEDTLAPYVFGGPVIDLHVAHNSLKAMDYAFGSIGLQAGVGAEFRKRWQLQGSYVWGMTYAMKAVKLLNFSAKSSYWNVRITYLF